MTDTTQYRIGIILAGGSGERFWPLSRRTRPKQLLRLTSETKTMLDEAVERLTPLIPAEHMYVITGEHLVEPIRACNSGLLSENIIAEPAKRNTTGALCYAIAHILAKYNVPEKCVTLAVVTADHQIGEAERFRATMFAALRHAEAHESIVTIGIAPTRPETGYGYIQARELAPAVDGLSQSIQVHHVSAFHEKPNRQRAEDFMNAGNYFWNSGMFFWTAKTFLDELSHAHPPSAETYSKLIAAFKTGDLAEARRIFETLEDISIDYALMEHAQKVLVVRADFPWDDVGAWTALERSHPADAQGNVKLGEPVVVESKDCIVYNTVGPEKMAVSVIGCEELVVIVTADAVLVMPKEKAQDVRHAVSELKKRNAPQL